MAAPGQRPRGRGTNLGLEGGALVCGGEGGEWALCPGGKTSRVTPHYLADIKIKAAVSRLQSPLKGHLVSLAAPGYSGLLRAPPRTVLRAGYSPAAGPPGALTNGPAPTFWMLLMLTLEIPTAWRDGMPLPTEGVPVALLIGHYYSNPREARCTMRARQVFFACN